MAMNYTDKVMKHMEDPHNVGKIDDADGVGKVGNPVCGYVMSIYIKVKGDKIVDIKFKTYGCGAAIATSSMLTDMVKGKTLAEAEKITKTQLAGELGSLPPVKLHCSVLAVDALHEAIKDYRSKKK